MTIKNLQIFLKNLITRRTNFEVLIRTEHPRSVRQRQRRPEDSLLCTADDPLAFKDTAVDGCDEFDGIPVAEGMSHFYSSRSLSYSQLRARAQEFEYVDLAGFLTSEVTEICQFFFLLKE